MKVLVSHMMRLRLNFIVFIAIIVPLLFLTDTGYCSDHIRGTIENADAYLVESNHEIEILRAGPYPWSLKQRILGDKGHLSNDDGALVMADV